AAEDYRDGLRGRRGAIGFVAHGQVEFDPPPRPRCLPAKVVVEVRRVRPAVAVNVYDRQAAAPDQRRVILPADAPERRLFFPPKRAGNDQRAALIADLTPND